MTALTLLSSAPEEVYEMIRPWMVLVRNGRQGVGAGILAGGGLVLTNAHVARRGHHLQVVLDDDSAYPARLVASDPQVDLALLHIPANGHSAAVFATGKPRPGELVYAIGHPWGQRNVLTGGVLSAVVSVQSRKKDIPLLRTDLHLAPGNSGGPLVNMAGEVMGINTMIFGGDQSFAIPSSLIRSFMQQHRPHQEGVL